MDGRTNPDDDKCSDLESESTGHRLAFPQNLWVMVYTQSEPASPSALGSVAKRAIRRLSHNRCSTTTSNNQRLQMLKSTSSSKTSCQCRTSTQMTPNYDGPSSVLATTQERFFNTTTCYLVPFFASNIPKQGAAFDEPIIRVRRQLYVRQRCGSNAIKSHAKLTMWAQRITLLHDP